MVLCFKTVKNALFIFILFIMVTFSLPLLAKEQIWMPETDFQTFSKSNLKKRTMRFVLTKGTRVKALGYLPFSNEGQACRVEVLEGPQQGEIVYIYFSDNEPNMLDVTHFPNYKLAASNRSLKLKSPVQTEAQSGCLDDSCQQGPSLQNHLSEWFQDSTQIVNEVEKNNPVVGARQVMALLYQSCDVLKLNPYSGEPSVRNNGVTTVGRGSGTQRKITNVNKAVENHYYLNSLQNYPNQNCLDMRKTPPLYQYGGRPVINSEQEIDLFLTHKNGGTSSFVGIDCSGFVSAALISAGLKVSVKADKAIDNVISTSTLMRMNDKNSCFMHPTLDKNSTIKSGDIIVERGHVIMIERVGPDPFGVAKMVKEGKLKKEKDCSKFDYDKELFEFTIIQSTGSHDLPASIMEARDWYDRNIYNNLFESACLAYFSDKPIKMSNVTTALKLLRHKGDSQEGCQFVPENKPTFKNNQCVGECKEANQ